MPAPAVYVLAVIGTVGAVLAFKEFVYEPHIAPAIDRWRLEFQTARAARRRRRAMEVSEDGSELLISETRKKSQRRSSDKYSDDDSDEDEDHGKSGATTGTSHSFMRDGLLLRRPIKSQGDVELDTLGTHDTNPWAGEVSGRVLRQRKNVSDHTLDESIHAIPYAPLTPNVVVDATAQLPSPPTSDNRSFSPRIPSPAPIQNETGAFSTEIDLLYESETPQEHANPHTSVDSSGSSHSHAASPVPPPDATSSQHSGTQFTQLSGSENSSTISTQGSYHQTIPSLSQSYPQDLDYEHDLELLSPPSSRADSPFSLAALSPNQGINNRPLSAMSSVLSSPSPLRMGLGNQSYDAISPNPHIQLIAPLVNPAYHSFLAEISQDGSDDSFVMGARGRGEVTSHAEDLIVDDEVEEHIQSMHDPNFYDRNAIRIMALTKPEGLGQHPMSLLEPRSRTAASSLYTPNASVHVGAGNHDPLYFRASVSPPSASPATTASSYITAYQGDTSAADFVISGQANSTHGDSELSDLDFMSDYQASESSEISDLGEVSDESWSVAGGSEAGMSPLVGPAVGRVVPGGRRA